jgi:hypothetical protein
MAQAQSSTEAENAYMDIAIRLRDIEEKQNIIKDRVLLLGENLVSSKEEIEKEITNLKEKTLSMEDEIRRLKLNLQMVLASSENFIRKNEFDILKRQFEMFQPLELARISDVENMIIKALNHHKKN